jgi:hypothetical protein
LSSVGLALRRDDHETSQDGLGCCFGCRHNSGTSHLG